jgi:copper resistance protein C
MTFQTNHPLPTDPAPRASRGPVALARPAAPRPTRLLTAALAALATLVATLLLGVAGAAPAQAHDRIISSDPADGAQLETAPAALTMTFSTEPLAVEPQVVVTNPAGTVVAQGSPTIEGASAIFPWPAELTGDTYTVSWRVVSSDGHPIEGVFSFAVAAAPAPVDATADAPVDAAVTGEAAEGAPSGSADSSDETAADATEDAGDAAPDAQERSIAPLLIGIGVLVAAAVVVAVLIVRRRQDQQD